MARLRGSLKPNLYASGRSPHDLRNCIVGAFNGNARGFELIRFDGAKSYHQGDRTTITADTGYPMYMLDITPTGQGRSGSLVQERNLERMPIGYLERFQGMTVNCLR